MSQNAVIFLLLCAVVVVFALGSIKRSAERDRSESQATTELHAAEAAIQVLARADGLAFDARTTARTPTELTPLPFPRGRALGAAQDLDDLHEMTPEEYAAADGTAFVATARVDYLDEKDAAAQRPTDRKRVTVAVTHPELETPVELSRVYTMPAPAGSASASAGS